MHDHNLDDLIIDNIEPKNSKTKSFLTIIALLIVVLIVAIILTKILLKTPNENSPAFEENTTEMIAPELKLKETPKPQTEQEIEEPSLPEIIANKLKAPAVETKKPVVIEEPVVVIKKEQAKPEMKLPEVPKAVETKKEPVLSNIIDQEIKAPVPETKKPIIVQAPLPSIKEKEAKAAKDAADIAYWKAMQEKRKAEEVAKESLNIKEPTVVIKEEKTEEVVKETVQIKEPVKPKPAVVKTPKPVVTPVKKPVKKPVSATPVPKSVSTTRYYVQVGSFRTKPSSRFISVIKNNGFNYTIKRAADGTRKLLIGPYKDRASVNRALINVKDRINKSAFVVKR